MANENEVEVDIGVRANELELQLRRTFEQLKGGLETAQQLQSWFERSARTARELPAAIKEMEDRLKRVQGFPSGVGLAGQIEHNKRQQQELNVELEREIRAQKELNTLRNVGRRAAEGAPVAGGRTAGEARFTEAALRDAITGINTTADQITARLALATKAAMERMLNSTGEAMQASLANASQRIRSQIATQSVPGYGDARVTNAYVSAQRTVALAARGGTLEEREAGARERATAEEENRLRTLAANRMRRDAERENAARDAAAREVARNTQRRAEEENRAGDVQWRRMRTEAEWENRNFDMRRKASDAEYRVADAKMRSEAAYEDRQRTLIRNRERREAERENKERDRTSRDAALGVYRDATEENAARDAQYRRQRTMADWDNRNFDMRRKAADAEYKAADTKMRSEAAFEDRQRTLIRNRERREAERENAERDRAEAQRRNPQNALRRVLSDESFLRQTGMERGAFQQQIAAQNLSPDQQAQIIRGMRQNTLGQRQADREARNTPAARAQQGFEQQDARFNLNGGADQFAFQARLAANYATFGLITGAIRGSLAALIEFDAGLKQFQAITGTTNTEMEKFRGNLLGIAADSKFSVAEITQVAVALGQTGLAADGVAKALPAVMTLAAASGSTLQESVEALTAVLGAYNMEASRAGDVADVFVAALNRTKLTMGQLQLGIQYAANIARDSNVSFSELTASIGAIAQAGVRSGSTIGTGMRQLITELSAPTEKLRGVLKELGIDLADVDLRTQGFTTVLTNLQASGFGTAEALRSLDLRAAAAFSALAGQTNKIALLEQEFLLTSSAAESAAKANESFSASGQRLINTIFSIVDKGFRPLVEVMAAGTGGVANLLKGLSEYGTILPLIATGLSTIAAAAAAIKITNLVAGLAGLSGVGGAGLFATGLMTGVLPVAATLAAGGGLLYFLSQVQNEADAARERLDQLKAVENDLMARQQSIQTNVGDIDKRLQTLMDRRERLNADPVLARNAVIDAQKAFGDLGLVIEGGSNSIDGLIAGLQKLRGEMSQEMPRLLEQQLEGINQQIAKLQRLQELEATRRQTEGKRTLNVGEVARGADPIFSQGRNADIAALGPDFAEVAAYMVGARQVDPADARGSTAGLTGRISAQLQTLRGARTDARLDTTMSPADRAQVIKDLDGRIETVEKVFKEFLDLVATVANEQALRVRAEVVTGDIARGALQASPEFRRLNEDRLAIYGQQDTAIRAARSSARGGAAFDAMKAAAHSTDEVVKAKLAEIEEAKKAAIENGTSKEDADAAYRELTDSFKALMKGVTKETRDQFAAAAPEIKASLQSSIRTDEAALALYARQAATSRDASRVAEYQALAKSTQEEINKAREKMFQVDQGPNADAVIENSPELKERREEIRQQGRDKITALGVTYAEIHRRLQDQLLSYRVDGENERKSLLETQIKGLEKVRDDARSTPEQMRAAVQEINRLLGEVAKIGQGINSLQADREALKVPQGAIPPSVTFQPGSVKQRIVDELRAKGASDEDVRYALASGQIESGYAPDVLSGARRSSAGATGLFQFMPKTWERMYGTRDVNTDISAQIEAFQKFSSNNRGTFQSNMGRAPTAEEMYLMHQQGAGGAMALLRGGSGTSAFDALRPFYKSDDAARSAITGNSGRINMTAEEFAGVIMRKFRSAENTVGNPFSTTGTEEVARRRQTANDRTADEEENRKAENDRKARESERNRTLADLRRNDRTLTETYETQVALAKRLQDPASAVSASKEAYGTLGQLYANARSADQNNRFGQSPDQIAEGEAGTRRRFGEMYAQQGLGQAESIGRTLQKRYTDELKRLEDRRKELERPENIGREGNTEQLNALNEQINQLQKRNELTGTYEANQAKIVALEQTLKEMQTQGLENERGAVSLKERLRDLTAEQKALEENRNFAGTQARTEKTYGEAFTGARDSFLKSRGVLDIRGNLVEPVVQAQKELETSLNTIGNAFDSLFTNLFNGTMKTGDALKKFATDILGGLMQQLSRSLTNDIFKSLLGGGKGDSGVMGGLGDIIGGLFGAGKYLGGPIRMAGGGGVPGGDAALQDRDSKLIYAQPGEFLLRKSATQAIGEDTLNQVNALGDRMISRSPVPSVAGKMGGATANTSVYVVAPDQVPPPGPNEVIHWIGDDMARGGAVAQMVKQITVRGY